MFLRVPTESRQTLV